MLVSPRLRIFCLLFGSCLPLGWAHASALELPASADYIPTEWLSPSAETVSAFGPDARGGHIHSSEKIGSLKEGSSDPQDPRDPYDPVERSPTNSSWGNYANDHAKRITSAEVVGALGTDLFGEQVNFYTGSTQFVHTDIDVPGNNALPVRAGRRFFVTGDKRNSTTQGSVEPQHAFGDWELDVPYMSGTYPEAMGWRVDNAFDPNQRCSSPELKPRGSSAPPYYSYPGGGGLGFYAHEFWNGNSIYIPGHGEQSLLLNLHLVAGADAKPHRWITKDLWRITCVPTLANSPAVAGDGFEVTTPDGTRYTFNYMASFAVPEISKTATSHATFAMVVPRREFRLYVTRVTDRFNNVVNYHWEGSSPATARLRSISSDSDSRLLTFRYVGTSRRVAAVCDGTYSQANPLLCQGLREVRYAYHASHGRLQTVTYPDNASWNIDLAAAHPDGNDALGGREGQWDPYNSQQHMIDCASVRRLRSTSGVGTLTHPSGAVGRFEFRYQWHFRSGVPDRHCFYLTQEGMHAYSMYSQGPQELQPWHYTSTIPRTFDTLAITQKRISGPGLAPMQWDYSYDNNQPEGSAYGSSNFPDRRFVRIHEPDGSQRELTFGQRYQVNEGQLLQERIKDSPNAQSSLRTTSYSYATSRVVGPYPVRPGINPNLNLDNFSAEEIRPLRETSILQNDVTFTRTVESFDGYANPVRVKRHSALGERTDEVTYHHNTALWVLGQVAESKNIDTNLVESSTDFHAATALPHKEYRFGRLVSTLTYHANGNANGSLHTVKQGANANVFTLSNYHRGVPRSIAWPTGVTQTAEVNNMGRITKITDVLGNTTDYRYDVVGRLERVDYPAETSLIWNAKTITYSRTQADPYFGLPSGHWQRTETVGSRRSVTYFDALWRPVGTREFEHNNTNVPQRLVRRSFDHAGREIFVSYPATNEADLGNGTWSSYDALGRLEGLVQDAELELGSLATIIEWLPGFKKQVTNPRGFQTTFSFRAYDAPSEELVMTIDAPEGQRTVFTRDAWGKPLSITRSGPDYASPWLTQSLRRDFVYNTTQDLCKRIDPEHGSTVFAYDGSGRLEWSADGRNLPSTSACNNASTVHVPINQRVTRTYDGMNRLTGVDYPDSSDDITLEYYPDGALHRAFVGKVSATTFSNRWTYHYNNRRLLTHETLSIDGQSFGLQYEYNARGDLSDLGYPDGSWVGLAPDALGRPRQVGDYAAAIAFHPNGQVAGFNYGNQVYYQQFLNARGLPQRRITGIGSSKLIDHTLVYDRNANLAEINDLVGSTANYTSENRTMGYDGLDRLTVANSAPQPPWQLNSPWNYSWGDGGYEYDALDNLRRYHAGPGPMDMRFQLDAKQRLSGATNHGNAFRSYSFNDRGQMTSREHAGVIHTLTWDSAHRLLSSTSSASNEYYQYDAHGHRVSITRDGGTVYPVYSRAGQLMAEKQGSIWRKHIYLGTNLIAEDSGGVRHYVHSDPMGTVRMRTDQFGAVQQSLGRIRAPYGSPLTGGYMNSPGFTGHMEDGGTGLTYMKARYYDPVAMRFLSPDPVHVSGADGGNFNRYWYANNNPYKYTDPDGREAVFAFSNGATLRDGVKTMAYLMKSPTARGEIGQLQGSRETYTIAFDGNRSASMGYDHDTRTVTINPRSGLRVGDAGEIQSPAIGAGHEISHAAEHDRIGTAAFDANLEAPVLRVEMTQSGGMSVTYGTSPEERRATGVESNIARELGEPTRASYTQEKGSVRTCGPTSRSEC